MDVFRKQRAFEMSELWNTRRETISLIPHNKRKKKQFHNKELKLLGTSKQKESGILCVYWQSVECVLLITTNELIGCKNVVWIANSLQCVVESLLNFKPTILTSTLKVKVFYPKLIKNHIALKRAQ